MPSLATPAVPPGSMAARSQPSIRGDGVLLRPWQAADCPAVVSAYADPAIRRWHCRSMSEDEARAWIARWPDRWTAETGAGWAVVVTGAATTSVTGSSTSSSAGEVAGSSAGEVAGSSVGEVAGSSAGEVAGQISLRRIDLHAGLAEVSYWVLPAARGQRVASRALSALAAWAFTDLGLHRVEVAHSMRNPASCRVAVLARFTAEGVKRSEARHADGWHDMHLHARLDGDM